MISGEGFLTQALLVIQYENVWSSYHHWVSQGKWRWRDLAHRLILLVCSKVPDGQITSIILDDLTIERCSAKAPACRIHRQHSKKKNRGLYILGQCWVFLAIAFQRPSDKVHTAISVMAFPSPKSGNISKIKMAKAMLKSVRQSLQGRILRLLTDSWFMNGPRMQPALELGYEVIGHIPKNRALYALPVEANPPSPFKRKGRKRIYGAKMTPEEVEKLPVTTMTVWLYRKYRTVSFRSCICRARFLKGRIVRVVWSRFENDKGQTETKLFLSINPDLEAHEVLLAYSLRWPIEPMFQQLKHEFGCKHLWQRRLRTVLRWMHIKMAGYALMQLLTICQNPAAIAIAKIAWRLPDTVTAGTLRRAMFWIIPQFRIRDCWNRYEQKLELELPDKDERSGSILLKAT
ncbi:hypothetical protein GZ78_17220 [Endozoicomonas numazuensis]|uniref:Transposase IS701-like DDE domain-containing protein n=2 Tax=Endozoicomonas numazuensis TaxID=1137799 RepID=A0A081NGC8_9GAMM|nr:hypothetical protein GZ78_17220 [Endozoicomonas numazuensis]